MAKNNLNCKKLATARINKTADSRKDSPAEVKSLFPL